MDATTQAHLPPATWPATVLMLNQQVACPDLPFIAINRCVFGSTIRGAIIGSHINLQFLRISSRRGFPRGNLLHRAVVVREVLGVRVFNFPARR